MAERRVEQFYVFMSKILDNPAATNLNAEALAEAHHAYLQDLADKGRLMGSGATKDETGKRYGGGIIIIRADSVADAEATAALEPYCREGQRSPTIIPWQRSRFEACEA
ncbi:MAG: hypothetical protein HN658_08640 [Rhodospirillales bacterium]|jgi:uncharacterized protein YciI|nr:hypothetical protein [Rhodospirillales bacterium]MBT4006056.1 hypothetical protein [Rhodospirillales bacterium]MBT5075746.1 hypothetical protein [Rhodospirillales bacterium]MBT5112799.1 hypothetical protein [Rhodospirillales bacterium]MBT5673569.1 hypothetical protein [Rhodospirillales bacterium]